VPPALSAGPDAVVFTSPMLDHVRQTLGSSGALPPTLVIHHRRDDCHVTHCDMVPPFMAWASGLRPPHLDRWRHQPGQSLPQPRLPRFHRSRGRGCVGHHRVCEREEVDGLHSPVQQACHATGWTDDHNGGSNRPTAVLPRPAPTDQPCGCRVCANSCRSGHGLS
jgi:hypothetical protein